MYSLKRYVFPFYFVIKDACELLNTNILQNMNLDFLLIDCKHREVFIVNKEICEFLLYFRKPHSFDEVSSKYEESDISVFFKLMTKAKILIKEDRLKSGHLYIPFKQSVFPEYKIIEILKDNNYILVAIVQDYQGRRYIIKHLKTGKKRLRLKYFQQEFDIYKLLGDTQYTCKLIEYSSKRRFALLEYLEGKSLKQLIESKELSINDKIILAEQIMEIGAYLHMKKIIHGDIHANQYIVDEKLNLKILDFGYGYNEDEKTFSAIALRGGCLNYLEPENITSNVFDFNRFIPYVPSMEAEVYRIGILMYYLFYEEYPIKNYTWKTYYYDTLNVKPYFGRKTPKNELIPSIFDLVMEKCLKKNASERFSSCVKLFEYYQNNNQIVQLDNI